MTQWPAGAVVITALAAACAGYQSYRPAPLQPEREAPLFAARRLDDAGLVQFLRDAGAAPTDSGWGPRRVGLAALYYRADLAESRAIVDAGRAGEIAAGVRPYPSASASVERAARPQNGETTPWSFSLLAGLTLETGGKRDARVARARAVTMSSVLSLDAAGWNAAQRARAAAITLLVAERDFRDARSESDALRSLLGLLEARYRDGQISLASLARAQTDVQSAEAALLQSARARTTARLVLARALAVPVAQVNGLALKADSRAGCSAEDSIPADSLRALALRGRSDVGVALTDYAVDEADLRTAVARQYPDITIGPGLGWNEGIARWVLSLGFPSIATDRNRGPIAEASARRVAQAARVAALQDSVIAAVDSGMAACGDAAREITAADSVVAATERQAQVARAAYARGEVGATEVAFAGLAVLRAHRARNLSVGRRALAGAMLEQAIGAWLAEPALRWPDLRRSPRIAFSLPASSQPGARR